MDALGQISALGAERRLNRRKWSKVQHNGNGGCHSFSARGGSGDWPNSCKYFRFMWNINGWQRFFFAAPLFFQGGLLLAQFSNPGDSNPGDRGHCKIVLGAFASEGGHFPKLSGRAASGTGGRNFDLLAEKEGMIHKINAVEELAVRRAAGMAIDEATYRRKIQSALMSANFLHDNVQNLPEEEQLAFFSDNRFESALVRLSQLELKRQGVESKLVAGFASSSDAPYFFLEILPSQGALGRLAVSVDKRFDLPLVYDPMALRHADATALVNEVDLEGLPRGMFISSRSIPSGRVRVRDGLGHEIRHLFYHELLNFGIPLVIHGEINNGLNFGLVDAYQERFSLEELGTFSYDLRSRLQDLKRADSIFYLREGVGEIRDGAETLSEISQSVVETSGFFINKLQESSNSQSDAVWSVESPTVKRLRLENPNAKLSVEVKQIEQPWGQKIARVTLKHSGELSRPGFLPFDAPQPPSLRFWLSDVGEKPDDIINASVSFLKDLEERAKNSQKGALELHQIGGEILEDSSFKASLVEAEREDDFRKIEALIRDYEPLQRMRSAGQNLSTYGITTEQLKLLNTRRAAYPLERRDRTQPSGLDLLLEELKNVLGIEEGDLGEDLHSGPSEGHPKSK